MNFLADARLFTKQATMIFIQGLLTLMVGMLGVVLVESSSSSTILLWVTAGSVLVGTIIGTTIARFGIGNPLRKASSALALLASGDLATAIPMTERKDEIGTILRVAEIFRHNLTENQRLTEETHKGEVEAEKRRILADLALDFEKSVRGVCYSVGQAAGGLKGTAQEMASMSEQTSGESGGRDGCALLGRIVGLDCRNWTASRTIRRYRPRGCPGCPANLRFSRRNGDGGSEN